MPDTERVAYETVNTWQSVATGPCDVVLSGSDDYRFAWGETTPEDDVPGFLQLKDIPLNVPVHADEALYVRSLRVMVFTRLVDVTA